jgi:hypothetical protein
LKASAGQQHRAIRVPDRFDSHTKRMRRTWIAGLYRPQEVATLLLELGGR